MHFVLTIRVLQSAKVHNLPTLLIEILFNLNYNSMFLFLQVTRLSFLVREIYKSHVKLWQVSNIKNTIEKNPSPHFCPIRHITVSIFSKRPGFYYNHITCGLVASNFLMPSQCRDNSGSQTLKESSLSDDRVWSMGLCASMSTCWIPGTSSWISCSNRSTSLPKAVTTSSPAKRFFLLTLVYYKL